MGNKGGKNKKKDHTILRDVISFYLFSSKNVQLFEYLCMLIHRFMMNSNSKGGNRLFVKQYKFFTRWNSQMAQWLHGIFFAKHIYWIECDHLILKRFALFFRGTVRTACLILNNLRAFSKVWKKRFECKFAINIDFNSQNSRHLNLKYFSEFYPNGRAEKFSAQVFDVRLSLWILYSIRVLLRLNNLFLLNPKVFDADQSGKIDFVEFLVAIASSSQADIRQRLKLGFKMYDKDNNGKIDKKEMLKMLLAIYDLMGQENRSGKNA